MTNSNMILQDNCYKISIELNITGEKHCYKIDIYIIDSIVHVISISKNT